MEKAVTTGVKPIFGWKIPSNLIESQPGEYARHLVAKAFLQFKISCLLDDKVELFQCKSAVSFMLIDAVK